MQTSASSTLAYPNHEEWAARKDSTPVRRIELDPERSPLLEPLSHRAVQIGLAGRQLRRYVNDWTVSITDVTSFAGEIRSLAAAGDQAAVSALLPAELPTRSPTRSGLL